MYAFQYANDSLVWKISSDANLTGQDKCSYIQGNNIIAVKCRQTFITLSQHG